MEWILGIQRALDYIEENLTEELDYEEIAKRSYSSSYHFQRVFHILCGYTLGEYIRCRRLSAAGAALAEKRLKVIDAAILYGYESPDSFARAFHNFHGISPSAAREPGAKLRSFSRLSLQFSLKGGNTMDYKIEQKEALSLIGYRERFTGGIEARYDQEATFWEGTRAQQDALIAIRNYDQNIWYSVSTNFSDSGYDHYITVTSDVESAEGMERIEIPAATYVVCQTERAICPTTLHEDLRKQMVEEWLPTSGYQLTDAPELEITYWFARPNREKRYIELWLPIEKIDS